MTRIKRKVNFRHDDASKYEMRPMSLKVTHFIASTFFGCIFTFSLWVLTNSISLCIGYYVDMHWFWFLPLIWGVLGIFWFSQMADIANQMFHAVFINNH